ncbi:MAG: hypothetical protein R6U91_05170 [Bacillota bacterium]
MVKIFIHKFLPILLVPLLLFIFTGCDSENEGETTYNVETDEEFQQSVEQILDRYLHENDEEAIYNELYEEFGDRYTEEEIRVHVRALLEEREDELRAELEIIQNQVKEAEEKVSKLEEELEEKADEDTIQELKEELAPLADWVEKLEGKIAETEYFYRKVEILEEMENTLLMIAEIMEDKIKTLQENQANSDEGAGAFLNYHHKIEELIEKDEEIQEAFEGVTGDNFISEQVLHDELKKNIIPKSEDLLDSLEDVDLETEEIRETHQTFEEAYSTLLQGYNLWVEAIQEEDQDMVEEAVELVEEGKTLKQTFLKELDQLFQNYTS